MLPVGIHLISPFARRHVAFPKNSFSKLQPAQVGWFTFQSFVGGFPVSTNLPFVDDDRRVLDYPGHNVVIASDSHSNARLQCQLQGPYLAFYSLDCSFDHSIRS